MARCHLRRKLKDMRTIVNYALTAIAFAGAAALTYLGIVHCPPLSSVDHLVTDPQATSRFPNAPDKPTPTGFPVP